MIFSADHRHSLGLLVMPELETLPFTRLLGSCLAAVEAGVAPAGLVVKHIESGRNATFEYGTYGAVVRSADAYLYDDAPTFGGRRLIMTVRLLVDLGEPGDTAMKMLLQLGAQRGDEPEFLLGRRMHVELNQHLAEDKKASALMATALARLVEISGTEEEFCRRLALEFCQQLAEAVVP